MSIDYFAYGANMNEESFTARYPSAVYCGIAKLEGYAFIINSKGVATIKREGEAAVYGVCWKISEEDGLRLDEFEGVSEGIYRSTNLPVKNITSGETAYMKVYISDNTVPGFPLPGYMRVIIESAALHRFPEAYKELLNRQDEELFG